METDKNTTEPLSPLMAALRRRDAAINLPQEDLEALANLSEDFEDFQEERGEDVSRFSLTGDLEIPQIVGDFSTSNADAGNIQQETKIRKKGGRKPSYNIDNFIQVFKRVCVQGGQPNDVAAELGMTIDQVSQRACQLRKKGHSLPHFKRGPKS